MDVRAAVAHKAGAALTIETVQLQGPKAGEVLVEIKATGICHTDEFTRSGSDPEGLFPAILGHEGAGVVVEAGPGVASVKKGDHVIPLYTPECRQCEYCLSGKTNLCQTAAAVFRWAARSSSTTWALRLSPTTPWCPKSRWRRSARTRRSTRCATSA